MGDLLDAELLALAGEDSSSDEGETFSAQHKSPSPRPPASSSSQRPPQDSETANEMGRRGTAVVKKPQKTARRKPSRKDGSEEGEASSGDASPKSHSSASMSESESDVDDSRQPASGDELAPPYPYQKFYYDAADKAKIEKLPELEREAALTDRRDAVDRYNQDVQIRRLLQRRADEETTRDKKKRKADVAEMEDGQRKSTRQKTTLGGRKVGETSENLEAYKRQREQKSQRKLLSPTKTKDRKHSPGSPFSDADADGESDVEWDDQKNGASRRTAPTVKDDEPMELKDVGRLVVPRHDLTKYCFYPTFETSVIGTFVRGMVGQMPVPTPNDPNHVEPDYRLGQIHKITEGPPYAFETADGKRYVTKQYICTTDNGKTRQFPFHHISRDEKIQSREFARWRNDLEVNTIKTPMKSAMQGIVNNMTALTHHSFTSQEITDKVAKQEQLRKIATTPNPTLVAKFKKQREEAIANGDLDEVERLDEEIRLVKPVTLAFGTQLYPNAQNVAMDPKTGERKLTEGERIAALNARNRKLNTENVRRAQIAERRAKQRNEEAAARGEGEVDTFARIKTRPKTNYDSKHPHNSHLTVPSVKDDLFDGSGTDRSRAGTPMSGTDTPKKVSTPRMLPRRTTTPSGVNGKKEPIGMIHGPANDDEIIGSLEFELDPDVAGALGL